MNKVIKRILRWAYYFPGNVYNTIVFRLCNVQCGSGLESTGRIFIKNKGIIKIGENVRINSKGTANPLGAGERTYMQVLKTGILQIQDGCKISNCAITCANSVNIGTYVMIGAGCKIYDTDFHSLNPYKRTGIRGLKSDVKTKGILINDFVFIGAGCYILKGVNIGRFSIVGAGSVVTGDIPEGEIWAGNPARLIRKMTKAELE